MIAFFCEIRLNKQTEILCATINLVQQGYTALLILLIPLIFLGLFVIGGIAVLEQTPSPTPATAMVDKLIPAASPSLKVYHSTKYKYTFKYPRDYFVHEGIDSDDEPKPARSLSDSVFVEKQNVECCANGVLSFRADSMNWTPRRWVEDYFFGSSAMPEVKDTVFGGKPAVEATARNQQGIMERIIVVDLGDVRLVILLEGDNRVLSDVLETFEFI